MRSQMTGAELKTWTKRAGFATQAHAARELGVNMETWYSYTQGRRDVPQVLALLCQYVEKYGLLE